MKLLCTYGHLWTKHYHIISQKVAQVGSEGIISLTFISQYLTATESPYDIRYKVKKKDMLGTETTFIKKMNTTHEVGKIKIYSHLTSTLQPWLILQCTECIISVAQLLFIGKKVAFLILLPESFTAYVFQRYSVALLKNIYWNQFDQHQLISNRI